MARSADSKPWAVTFARGKESASPVLCGMQRPAFLPAGILLSEPHLPPPSVFHAPSILLLLPLPTRLWPRLLPSVCHPETRTRKLQAAPAFRLRATGRTQQVRPLSPLPMFSNSTQVQASVPQWQGVQPRGYLGLRVRRKMVLCRKLSFRVFSSIFNDCMLLAHLSAMDWAFKVEQSLPIGEWTVQLGHRHEHRHY